MVAEAFALPFLFQQHQIDTGNMKWHEECGMALNGLIHYDMH
jgi:hypothetical protein